MTFRCFLLLLMSCFCLCVVGQTTEQKKTSAADLIAAARKQIGVTTAYDPAYVALAYPNGDVPAERGVCTDVLIRAMRLCGTDLQQAVHEDMKQNFADYPKTWGLKSTDKNIDHRRVPNLMTFFKRKNMALGISANNADYLPGDIVTCMVAGKLPHVMIVSDKTGTSGKRMILHNIGQGAQEEDRLFEFPHTGHYRWRW